MKILITGNMGYVGPVLVEHLRARFPHARLEGYDAGYFAHCLTGATHLPEVALDAQYFGDMRDFPATLLVGCDAVVHLAAISNDPMGRRFEDKTKAINHGASAALARLASEHGVRRFVFASSCSIYGYAAGGARRESDELNPLTAYARSKVETEQDLARFGDAMQVTSLRFSTACGFSPRLRLDLVLNDFVASALSSGTIDVLSDGTPWRPLIHVRDMARAIEWALTREPRDAHDFVAVNVGSDAWNVQIGALAQAVARLIPGTTVRINRNAPPDRRSYQVDFGLYRALAPDHQPTIGLEGAIAELVDGLRAARFSTADFRESDYMRLRVLERQIESGLLSEDLRWTRH